MRMGLQDPHVQNDSAVIGTFGILATEGEKKKACVITIR